MKDMALLIGSPTAIGACQSPCRPVAGVSCHCRIFPVCFQELQDDEVCVLILPAYTVILLETWISWEMLIIMTFSSGCTHMCGQRNICWEMRRRHPCAIISICGSNMHDIY